MFLPRKRPAPHLVGVRPDGVLHRFLELSEPLHELRPELVEEAEEILHHQYLPVAADSGGLLVPPPQIRERDTVMFAVLPEADVVLGYQLTDTGRIFAGYTFWYLSDVARPGAVLRRGFPDAGSEFWMQGIQMGLELRF